MTSQNDTTPATPRTTEHGRHRRTPGPWHVWRSGRKWKIRRRAFPMLWGGTSFGSFEEARLWVVIQQEIWNPGGNRSDYALVSA